MNCYDAFPKDSREANKIVNKTAFAVLAGLLTRAITGKLKTAPNKKFSMNELDRTDSNGKNIAAFLKNPDHFPAKTSKGMIDFLDYVLSKLICNQVAIGEELRSIYDSLDPLVYDLPDMLFFIKIVLPNQKDIKKATDKQKKKTELVQAEKKRLRQKIKSLEKQIETLRELHNAEITKLTIANSRQYEYICGLIVGQSTKSTRLKGGTLKTYIVWYAYDHGKKIYLGTKYNKAKFKKILQAKGYPKSSNVIGDYNKNSSFLLET